MGFGGGGGNTLETPGIYLPPSWGQFWKPKRSQGKAVIGVVGDSLGAGLFASFPNTKGMHGLVQTALQAKYGDGGSGLVTAGQTTPEAWTALAYPAPVITNYTTKPSLVSAGTGAWTFAVAAGLLAGGVIQSTVLGSTRTFTVRGTSVTVYYTTGAGSGLLAWTIDGVAQTPINQNAATNTAKVTVAGLAPGVHTVVFTAPGTANVQIAGVSGENTSGIIVNNYSIAGAQSGNFNDNPGIFGVGWNGGRNYPCDCLIYHLSANDAANSSPGDTWTNNVRGFMQGVKETTQGATDVIFVMPHIGTYDAGQLFYQQYVARMRGLAEGYNAAIVNFWALGRNSYQYWSSLNYFCADDGSGGPGPDVIHLSDVGQAYHAQQLLSILTA